jgi:hypothetical protein
MKQFTDGQRIRVVETETEEASVLEGETGVVVRLRMGDSGAWVKMDNDLPDNLRSFSKDDVRANHILLYPEECEANL